MRAGLVVGRLGDETESPFFFLNMDLRRSTKIYVGVKFQKGQLEAIKSG